MAFPGEQLLIKLWDTLADKGIGSLLKPWQIKREGLANIEVRRQEALALAQVEADVTEIRQGRKRLDEHGKIVPLVGHSTDHAASGPVSVTPLLCADPREVEEVAFRNAAAASVRSEVNVAKTLIKTEELLKDDPQAPPDRSIDDDWLFYWREQAGRVSSEELQQLWASALAGELKSPGSFSLRTLDFIRSMSQAEAKQIEQLASFVVHGYVIRIPGDFLDKQGMPFSLFHELQQMGVLSGVEALGLETTFSTLLPNQFIFTLQSNGKALVIKNDDPTKTVKLPIYVLTALGRQLMQLGHFQPRVDYLTAVAKLIADNDNTFTVLLGDWIAVTETTGRLENQQVICAPPKSNP